MFTSSEQAAGVHEMVFLVRLLHAEETFVLLGADFCSLSFYGPHLWCKVSESAGRSHTEKTGLGLSD